MNWLGDKVNELIKDYNSILDIGCGNGVTFIPLKENVCYVGIEANPQRIVSFKKELHKNKISEDNKFFLIHNFSDGNILFVKDSFDCVVLLDVIEHLSKENAEMLLKNIEVVAKKMVIIFTPLFFLEQESINDLSFDKRYDTHKCGFDSKEFEDKGYVVELFDGDKSHKREHKAILAVKRK